MLILSESFFFFFCKLCWLVHFFTKFFFSLFFFFFFMYFFNYYSSFPLGVTFTSLLFFVEPSTIEEICT